MFLFPIFLLIVLNFFIIYSNIIFCADIELCIKAILWVSTSAFLSISLLLYSRRDASKIPYQTDKYFEKQGENFVYVNKVKPDLDLNSFIEPSYFIYFIYIFFLISFLYFIYIKFIKKKFNFMVLFPIFLLIVLNFFIIFFNIVYCKVYYYDLSEYDHFYILTILFAFLGSSVKGTIATGSDLDPYLLGILVGQLLFLYPYFRNDEDYRLQYLKEYNEFLVILKEKEKLDKLNEFSLLSTFTDFQLVFLVFFLICLFVCFIVFVLFLIKFYIKKTRYGKF